jgi:membrane-associated protease RseP (regulator of RpoE activity)
VSSSELELEIIGPDGVPVGVVRPLPPAPRRIWLHVLLFIFTLGTTTIWGGILFADVPPGFKPTDLLDVLLNGSWLHGALLFSGSLLLILFAHEMGHYIASRRHRLDATLPFFIPFPLVVPMAGGWVPFGIGTLGAVIRIRSPLRTKRELFDVGAAGPLAGFLVALPVLIAGVALEKPALHPGGPGTAIFADPLAIQFLSWLLHPSVPTGTEFLLNPIAAAGWFGLLVTALNLLPFGQLDGGHITYALFGRWQRRIAWPLLAVLVVMGFWWMGWWLWAVIALLLRVRHPWIPDEATPLDPRRRLLGWLCIVIFVLCFTPEPVKILP